MAEEAMSQITAPPSAFKMMDLGSVKKDFTALLTQVQPWTLSHFVMWLDIKVAEYKVFGRMIMADNTPNDTPQWLRASADYLEQQHKEAQATATLPAGMTPGDKDMSPPAPPPPPPPLSPRSANTIASLRPSQQTIPINSSYEPVTSFATSSSSQYTVSTVNTTVVSPSVSPAFTGLIRPPPPIEQFQKQQSVPITSPEIYAKPSAAAPFPGYHPGTHPGTQRIPPISHLSPKHIRQSHLEQHNLSMSLPVSLAPGSMNKDFLPPHASKESLTTAEVESQIAVLESQIAAVNRSLKQSAQVAVEPVTQSTSVAKAGRRKADSTTDDASFIPPPYPKKSRQQSPVSANRVNVESTLPPLHSSMDMLARMHRLDTDSTQNIQSTLEAFEALRTQTFPPNSEVLRTQIVSEAEAIQNTAQDMSMHHVAATEREQLPSYSAAVERETATAAYQVEASEREQTYTPTSMERETANATYNLQSSEVQVKVEAGQSDEDSLGAEGNGYRTITAEEAQHQQELAAAGHGPGGGGPVEDQAYPVSLYQSGGGNNSATSADEKLAAEISTKKMRRKFLESMKNSNPKYYSHQIQQIIPFPEKFPVSNLDYGLKALQMIQTGEITRAGKIQLIDTIFHELIKYTGLYPTPNQKMQVANSIVETFPTLAAKMKASHISPADSWYVILCDKFRNERRGLGGAGTSPRVGKSPKQPKDAEAPPGTSGAVTDPNVSAAIEAAEEVEVRTTEEEVPPVSEDHVHAQHIAQLHQQTATPSPTMPPSQTPPTVQQQYVEAAAQAHAAATAAYHQGYTSQMATGKEQTMPVEMMSDDDEEDLGEGERLLNSEERRVYSEKAKRSVRRKTHSPKRVQKADTPILDERYAASLLEYYSKHKPYYPGDGDFNRAMDIDSLKNDSSLVIDDKGGVSSISSMNQAVAQAVASQAVSQDEPYSAEVAAIVQSVVSAHMDEVLAARNYQAQAEGGGGGHYGGILAQPQEVEGTVEVKTSAKKKQQKLQQKEKTPEQLQVSLQRFKQKLAVTYPGVQAADDSTLLCTCGTKVKLGRARMLHNYTNYHLKRCQNPPSTYVRQDSNSPTGSMTPGSVHGMYAGSPGEINIPVMGPKVITKEVESAAYAGLSAADRESIQKHFLLNIPIPTSDSLNVGQSSTPESQSLDLTMPVSGQNALNMPTTGQETLSMSGVNDADMVEEEHSETRIATPTEANDLSMLAVDESASGIPTAGQQTTLIDSPILSSAAVDSGRPMSAPVTVTSESPTADSQSLDLSVQQTSGPSVLIEHQPGSDLRVQIPVSIATSIAEYSGELPDLSAMNALAMIQGKTDHTIETMEAEPAESEEPINLADS